MTDLLPIVFQRGQDESIDPRVAPAEVHASASNVRWRKDGRPAKRYGRVSVSTTGYEQGTTQYLTQPMNAIASWQGQPLLAVGGGVAQRVGSTWGQHAPTGFTPVDLSHWGPGARSTIVSPETYALKNLSVASGSGVALFLWDDGTNLFYCARGRDGAALVLPAQLLTNAIEPRTIPSTANSGRYIYFLYRLSGTGLMLGVFDTTNYGVTSGISVATLGAATYNFDAASRGADFLVAYQFTATQGVVKLYTAAGTAPTVAQTQTFTMSSSVAAKIGVAGTSTSDVFAGYVQDVASGGRVAYVEFNNAVTATVAGPTIVETDVNNLDQPSFVVEANASSCMVWGGQSSRCAYTRFATVDSTGVSVAATTRTGCRPASKAFSGPALSTLGTRDSRYVWSHTHNDTAGTTWDDQRGYVLVQLDRLAVIASRRMLHVPNVAASSSACTSHLADVYNEGTGYGYSVALIGTTRLGVSGAESFSAEWVTFRSIFESQRQAARDTAVAGRVIQFSGGALAEYSGSLEETGFTNAPVILTATAVAGGSLTASSNYLYRVVYEYLDAQGRRQRSTPSDPKALATTGANLTGQLLYQPLVTDSRMMSAGALATSPSTVTAHVYRTLAGQGTYHRVTPNTGAPVGVSASSLGITYTDTMSDAAAVLTEILYTDGGVVPNTLPPPCTFMCVCNNRLWVGGQLDRNVITASKILVDGEPTQFSDEAEFSAFLPQECTGLASIDGTVVAFARERIYFVTGDGPNDQGIGSFNPPTELPTDVGCIDWRSIVECSQGVFFQSKRGIFLLPRGFNTPIFVGAPVEATLATYPIVVSATLVSTPSSSTTSLGEITARFVVTDAETGTASKTLVYDMRTGGWSVDSAPLGFAPHGLCGTWLDTFVVTESGAGGKLTNLFAESPGTYADNTAFIPTSLGTGDIRPFGLAGYGGFDRVVLVGEYRGNAQVGVSVSVDGATADTYYFTVTSADNLDGSVYLDVSPKIRMGSSIRVTCFDNEVSALTPTEGFVMQGLFIEHEAIGKTKRLAAARKA